MTTPTTGVEAKTLSLHNAYRNKHGVSPLIWSSLLEKAARDYANDLISRNAKVVSKSDVPWGQNLFELRSQQAGVPASADHLGALEKAVETWYRGREDYDWNSSSNSGVGSSGLSFSQIVWRVTERVGVGIAHSYDKSRYIVVAFYDPPGNLSGEFSNNVYRDQNYPASQGNSGLPSTNGDLRTMDLFNNLTISGGDSSQNSNANSQEERTIHITTTTTSSTSSTWNSDNSQQNSQNSQNQNRNQNVNQIQIQNQNSPQSGSSASNPTGQIYPGATPAEIAALEKHNNLRSKHGAPPLNLDKKLCESAGIQAKSLLNGVKATGHVGVMEVGQNVYQMTGGAPPSKDKDVGTVAVAKAIDSWYGHQKEYNYDSPLISGKFAGLFSQIVWKESDKLGVGVATRGDLTIVVCLYSNQGNLMNDKNHRENVCKPIL